MQVILLEDVEHVGARGAIVEVKPGHARNFLVPKKLAQIANPTNKRQLAHLKKVASFAQAKAQAATRALRLKLANVRLEVARKVGEQEKMFGSVTVQDIHAALLQKGVDLDRRKVELSEPIKALGEYDITLRLSTEIKTTVKLAVVAE